MPIAVTCTQCQKNFRVADNFAGKQGRCPQCNFVLIVPNPEARGNSKPFGETEGPPAPPPPRRERPPEPPPRRRPDRDERDDYEERPPRPPRRSDGDRSDRDRSDRDRDPDDDYEDRPSRGSPSYGWQTVGFARSLLVYESILNLVGRGCLLFALILSLLTSDGPSRDADPRLSIVLGFIGMTCVAIGYGLGLAGRLGIRLAPDSVVRHEVGISTILSLSAFGVLILVMLVSVFGLAPGPGAFRRAGGGAMAHIVIILTIVGFCLTYASEIFLARFIARVGKLSRNRSLPGWGPIITIYMVSLMVLSVVVYLIGLTTNSGEFMMTMLIIFLAVDYGGAVMCLLPRPRLDRPLRQLQAGGSPVRENEDRFDEDEDDDRPTPPRDRRRYRDEEYD
jgi:hypothetical protein